MGKSTQINRNNYIFRMIFFFFSLFNSFFNSCEIYSISCQKKNCFFFTQTHAISNNHSSFKFFIEIISQWHTQDLRMFTHSTKKFWFLFFRHHILLHFKSLIDFLFANKNRSYIDLRDCSHLFPVKLWRKDFNCDFFSKLRFSLN